MLNSVVRIKIKSGMEAEWESVMAARRRQVLRDEPDTLVYDVWRSQADPSVYVVMESFASEDARVHHFKSSRGHERMIACFAEPPTTETYDPAPSCASAAMRSDL
jgi:quinol monooxygenase YgiN